MLNKHREDDHDARVRDTMDLIVGYYVQSAAPASGPDAPPAPAPERQAPVPVGAER